MSSKLQQALRKKYATPEAALRALGLPASLIAPPRLACDEAEKAGFRQLLLSLRANRKDTADGPLNWPEWDRIKIV